MKVHAAQHHGRPDFAQKAHKAEKATQEVAAQQPVDEFVPTAETEEQPKTYSRAHGVMRLLEAGHFKPHTEAVLRRNFADMLTPAEAPEGEIPVEGEVPVDGELPVEGEVPVEGEIPVESEVPVEGEVPADGTVVDVPTESIDETVIDTMIDAELVADMPAIEETLVDITPTVEETVAEVLADAIEIQSDADLVEDVAEQVVMTENQTLIEALIDGDEVILEPIDIIA